MSSQEEHGVSEVNASYRGAGTLAVIPARTAVSVREMQERFKTADLSDRELEKELAHYQSVMAYVRVAEGLRERAETHLKALEAEMWERHRRKREHGNGTQKVADEGRAIQ
jgi:hypothetical protein